MASPEILKLAMWSDWQKTVRASLPNFATHPIYVDQGQPEEEFRALADQVYGGFIFDRVGQTRDAEFGARVVSTRHGNLTRMWLDSEIELNFLRRQLPKSRRVLDIGAGYGRLAVAGAPYFDRYVCVDAVPVSTEVCRKYCGRFAPSVEIPSLPDFLAIYRDNYRDIDLAINVHSWNECTRPQIAAWLDVLCEIGIPHLFTVSHGQNDASIERSYYAWEPGRPSFRPLIEERYELIAEESIGFSRHPHAIWRRK